MRRFDYSFLDSGLLPSGLVDLCSNIYSLRTSTDLRKTKHINVFTELEKIAIIQSVKGSNAIEGIYTSDQRILDIVNKNSSPLNHDEQEIAGYRDALNIIHTNFENINFTVNDILLLHKTMLSFSNDELAGKFKESDNVIMEIGSDGSRRVRFYPTPASQTSEAMKQLELAYLDACSNAKINKLLLIPCVILDFLCIHPFADGNGRMSRLLSLLLLYKNGFDTGKYISFEQQINRYKDLYYDALQKSSYGWDKNENSYFPFMQNFLMTLFMCYRELDTRFAIVSGKRISKSGRIEATILNSLIPISKSEIAYIHPDISISTIEAVLSKLLKDKQIKKIGTYKNCRYIRNN